MGSFPLAQELVEQEDPGSIFGASMMLQRGYGFLMAFTNRIARSGLFAVPTLPPHLRFPIIEYFGLKTGSLLPHLFPTQSHEAASERLGYRSSVGSKHLVQVASGVIERSLPESTGHPGRIPKRMLSEGFLAGMSGSLSNAEGLR